MRRAVIWVLLLYAFPLSARVVEIEIIGESPVLEGQAFGLAGPYEKIKAKINFALDPTLPANQIITDISKAPRNAAGEVEFSADFYVLKPVNAMRGNGAAMLGVVNRGRKLLLSALNGGKRVEDPSSPEEFGDGFLMREGYTLVWVGWQFDVPPEPALMRLTAPAARDGAAPIRGLVRSNFVTTEVESDHSLADRNHQAYPAADPGAEQNVLTVRDSVEEEGHVISRGRWGFGRLEDGEIVSDPTRVYLHGGFQPGKIYEVVYLSQDPPVAGLGLAAVRDVATFLKRGESKELGLDLGSIERVHGFGVSQCGRFLRTFLYYGFNQGEDGKRALDGILSMVAGGGRGSFNHRFAQPSRDAHPFMNFFYPTDIFPFTDLPQEDRETGAREGLLDRTMEAGFQPKVFYANSSYEYWGRAASLVHTTIDGKEDIRIPENSRVFLFAGTQHGPAGFPPTRTIGQQLSNPMDFRWAVRALLTALDDWVESDAAPPDSAYPKVQDGSLVNPGELGFPEIPGVGFSRNVHFAYRASYGPRFKSEGIVDQQPPTIGSRFPVLVPAVDKDGNETAGIRLPEQAVPLATYTGWNLFNAESGPTHEISSMAGSYLPFPRSKAEREKLGDPRLSIEERYSGREQYLGRIAEHALKLMEQGYLLEGDLPEILREAGRHWDYLVNSE